MNLPTYRKLREILKNCEWGDEDLECPSCGYGKPISETEKKSNGGHNEDCLLRSALDDLTDEALERDEKERKAELDDANMRAKSAQKSVEELAAIIFKSNRANDEKRRAALENLFSKSKDLDVVLPETVNPLGPLARWRECLKSVDALTPKLKKEEA